VSASISRRSGVQQQQTVNSRQEKTRLKFSLLQNNVCFAFEDNPQMIKHLQPWQLPSCVHFIAFPADPATDSCIAMAGANYKSLLRSMLGMFTHISLHHAVSSIF